MKDAFLLMQEVETGRADGDAGGEIAEDGAEFQAVEDRNSDGGGAEISRGLNQKLAFFRRHTLCLDPRAR